MIVNLLHQTLSVLPSTWFAWACETYAGGSPRAAETIFGWNRKSVARGMSESEAKPPEDVTSDILKTLPNSAGRPRIEVVMPELLPVVEQLLSENSQADPQLCR